MLISDDSRLDVFLHARLVLELLVSRTCQWTFRPSRGQDFGNLAELRDHRCSGYFGLGKNQAGKLKGHQKETKEIYPQFPLAASALRNGGAIHFWSNLNFHSTPDTRRVCFQVLLLPVCFNSRRSGHLRQEVKLTQRPVNLKIQQKIIY